MKRALLIGLIVLAFPGTAWAHATLLHTSPTPQLVHDGFGGPPDATPAGNRPDMTAGGSSSLPTGIASGH
jgi:hypothetical protein